MELVIELLIGSVYLVLGGLVAKLVMGEIGDSCDYMIAGMITIFWPLVAIVYGIGRGLTALWDLIF